MLGRACRCWLPLEVAHVVGAWVSYRTRPPPPPASKPLCPPCPLPGSSQAPYDSLEDRLPHFSRQGQSERLPDTNMNKCNKLSDQATR